MKKLAKARQESVLSLKKLRKTWHKWLPEKPSGKPQRYPDELQKLLIKAIEEPAKDNSRKGEEFYLLAAFLLIVRKVNSVPNEVLPCGEWLAQELVWAYVAGRFSQADIRETIEDYEAWMEDREVAARLHEQAENGSYD